MSTSFRIYSSSAGSGKTYQLTKEYLVLALGSDDPGYFKRVLAITFTNDAAGEMKKRIVEALRQFAHSGPGAEDSLLTEVAAELKLPASEVRRRAAATFRLVLYHYADFAVSTIDAFVQRIVTAFTRELGLPATFEVELDTDSVLQGAVAALLDKVNRDPNSELLSKTLAEYALGQAEEGKSWGRLPEELANFGKNLFGESVQEAVTQLGKLSLADFRRLDKEIRSRRAELEAQAVALGQQATEALAAAGLTPTHLNGGERGIYTHFAKPLRWLESGDTPTATAVKVFETGKWSSGAAQREKRLDDVESIRGVLEDSFLALAELRAAHLNNYLLLAGMQPYLFHASLLSELNKIVEQISRERNVVLISEFNRRIAEIVLSEPVPFVYERIGEKYEHLLIDEFQDTSVLQWNNLLPLVENTLSRNFSSLAVGDAKQAIYRWRGGEMEQILRLHQGNTDALVARAREPEMRELLRLRYETVSPRLEPKSLQTNYRSAREIVDFNNDFFRAVRERHPDLTLVTGIYDAASAQEPHGAAGAAGHVELLFTAADAPARPYRPGPGDYAPEPLPGYPADARLTYDESTCFVAERLVRQALADDFALADIAILCRTRKASKILAKFLKERGYPIISADSLALEFAEVVNLVVSIFRVLHQPADTLARAEALVLVDRVVRRQAPTPARARHLSDVANLKDAKSLFDELRDLGYDVEEEQTGNLGLYELAERLLNLFGLLGRNGESEYLFRFLDLTLDYSLRYGNNLGNFLTYWDERKGRISINAPAGRAAITITTVHKAKGLAYGVVIVPFADWTLEPYRGTLLWGHLEAAGKPLDKMPDVAVVSLHKGLQQTVLAAQYDDEREKTFLEGLNTLYVAFTRPRHRLYIISKRPEEKSAKAATDELSTARTVADLLHGYLLSRDEWQSEQISFVISQGANNSRTADSQQLMANSYALTNLASAPWEERLKLRRHADNVFDFDEQQRLNEWNRKLHYALRRTLTAADVPRVAGQLVAEGIISLKEREQLTDSILRVVQNPRLTPYFAEHLSVETEREILIGGVQLRDYKPDRVVLDRTGRRVTLLDFKLPPPQERHKKQLRNYATLFEQLGYEEVRGVLYYFGSGEVVEV